MINRGPTTPSDNSDGAWLKALPILPTRKKTDETQKPLVKV